MIQASTDARVRAQTALQSGELTPRQRVLVADVLLAVDILVGKEPDDFSGQDAALSVLREEWTRLDEAMGGTP
ncbi:hypothetical protein GCM10023201_40650 [Actinomycetospora corticicola]|uniref:Uncharacterized protein n=1 Tax=Actinomycetospora corticicola TaxID=663602 RepID=A0A7Y9DWR3_9PSEU|nr:hypothetical protein [Actinomycetospora corticicola]NYD36851.1 hypothetical protein [Actinomycetospora corticicola]